MFIPIIPHTTVINKTVVYSDTVLPLKDFGNKLKICSISNVNEDKLEDCLKVIFKSNPSIVFNTVQYSKQNKKVYFYTDKTINTQAWEEKNITKYKHLSNNKEILEEIKILLTKEKTKDLKSISLYDISNLIKKYENEHEYIKKKYSNYFENILNSKYYDSNIIIKDFNYKKKQLEIEFKHFKDYEKIIFKKQNEDLYVTESESLYSQEILSLIGSGLSKLYDELIKFEDFKNQSIYNIKSVNSNFLVNISKYGVYICDNENLLHNFKLASYSYNKDYKYECNSEKVLSALKGNEDEIFKRIFIKIDDCPNWSKQTLYQIRQAQLDEEKLLEEKQLQTEMKKQKRLELKRKIFPWINKKG